MTSPPAVARPKSRHITRFIAVAFVTALAFPSRSFANGRFPRAEQLIEDPTAPDHWVLTATYGLVSTSTRGQNWFHVCDGAFTLTDDSYQGDALLSFLDDGTLVADVQTSLNLSRDGACSWTAALAPRPSFVIDHAIARSAPSTVLAVLSRVGDGGLVNELVVSRDHAQSFAPVGAPLPVASVYTLDIDPTDPAHVYATGLAGNVGQFLVSHDQGASWSASPIAGTNASEVPYIAAIDPRDPRKIFVRTDAWLDGSIANDALLYSEDEGKTWRELLRSQGKMYGFALSPDATSVLVGFGDPNEGAGRTAPGPLGLYASSTANFSFERVFTGHVNCVTWTTRNVYLCSSQDFDGFELARAKNPAAPPVEWTFEPVLLRGAIRGPLSCAPGSTASVCASRWDLNCQAIDACDGGAPVAIEGAPAAVDSGCACHAAGPPMKRAPAWALASFAWMYFRLFLRGDRRRRWLHREKRRPRSSPANRPKLAWSIPALARRGRPKTGQPK